MAVVFLAGTPLCAGATQYDKQITGSGTNYKEISTIDGDQTTYTFRDNDTVTVINKPGVRQAVSDFTIEDLHLTVTKTGSNARALTGIDIDQSNNAKAFHLIGGSISVSNQDTSYYTTTGMNLVGGNLDISLHGNVEITVDGTTDSSWSEVYGLRIDQASRLRFSSETLSLRTSGKASGTASTDVYGIRNLDQSNYLQVNELRIESRATSEQGWAQAFGVKTDGVDLQGKHFTIETSAVAHENEGNAYTVGIDLQNIAKNQRDPTELSGSIQVSAKGETSTYVRSIGILTQAVQNLSFGDLDIVANTSGQSVIDNHDEQPIDAFGLMIRDSSIRVNGGSIRADIVSNSTQSNAIGVYANASTVHLGQAAPMNIVATSSKENGFGIFAVAGSQIYWYGGSIFGDLFGIQLDDSSLTVSGNSLIQANRTREGEGISLVNAGSQLTITDNSTVRTNSLHSSGKIQIGKNALVVIDSLSRANNGSWNLSQGSELYLGDAQTAAESPETIKLGSMTANAAAIHFAAASLPYVLTDFHGDSTTLNLTKAKANSVQITADTSTNLTVHGNSTGSNNYRSVQEFADALGASVTNGTVGYLEANTVTGDEGNILPAFRCTVLDHNRVVCSSGSNSKLDALGSLTALSALQWRQELDDLTLRLGEVRLDPGKAGSWVRVNGSELEYGKQNLTAKNSALQVGSDVDVGSGWKVGAALRYSDGSATYAKGDADTDSYGLGVYGTWLGENGHYVDLVAKYSRLSTDFRLNGMDGSFKNHAYTVSAEYGWNVALNSIAFVEPQAQLTYGRIVGEDFSTGNGVTVRQDNFDSLIGRLGVRAGFHLPEHAGTVYARASVLHDFLGKMDATATNGVATSPIHEDLGGTWLAYSVGANFPLGKQAYTYVDLQRTAGGEVQDNWRWNLGLRYVW